MIPWISPTRTAHAWKLSFNKILMKPQYFQSNIFFWLWPIKVKCCISTCSINKQDGNVFQHQLRFILFSLPLNYKITKITKIYKFIKQYQILNMNNIVWFCLYLYLISVRGESLVCRPTRESLKSPMTVVFIHFQAIEF